MHRRRGRRSGKQQFISEPVARGAEHHQSFRVPFAHRTQQFTGQSLRLRRRFRLVQEYFSRSKYSFLLFFLSFWFLFLGGERGEREGSFEDSEGFFWIPKDSWRVSSRFFFLMVVRDSVLLRVLGLKSRIRLIVLGTLEDYSGIVPGTPWGKFWSLDGPLFRAERPLQMTVTIDSLNWNQEKATKWETEKGIDGLTTNGVLLLHPKGGFNGEVPSACTWVEVSVGGALYHLRDSRSAPQKKSQVRHQPGSSLFLEEVDSIDVRFLFGNRWTPKWTYWKMDL